MALYQVLLQGITGADPSNPINNVFTYVVDDVLPGAENALALANAFQTGVLAHADGITKVLSSAMSFNLIYVTSPYDPSVMGVKNISIPGTRIGDALPKFNVWRFKHLHTVRGIHDGRKAFGVISESDTAGNQPSAVMSPILTALAARLSAVLSFTTTGGTFNATPYIVKRVKVPLSGGGYSYRLPNSPLEFQGYPATSWVYADISTQNTRKR